jgi:AraC-like DNA-binding protein
VLTARFALPEDAADREDVPVTPGAFGDLLEAIASILGEPFLALRLPGALPLRRYGLAELAARSSATLREGLTRLSRYASLIHPGLECLLEEDATEARWRQRTPGRPRGLGRHAHEFALAYVLGHARAESGLALTPSRVWLAHARPPDLTPLHRFLGTRAITFGESDTGFALEGDARAALDAPMLAGDARLLATATELAEAALRAQPRTQSMTPLVAARIEALLPEAATMETVARALHMSDRTLQRRLEQEGTRFSEVADGVREDLARRLIADPALSLGEIGYRVGLADLATFSRAFKRWTGMPPGTWRKTREG